MQAYESERLEADASPDLDAPVFGVDRDGCLHRYDNGDVVVTRDGDLDHHETNVGRDGIDSWISYVGQKRAWTDVWWNAQGVDTAARLSNALTATDQESGDR